MEVLTEEVAETNESRDQVRAENAAGVTTVEAQFRRNSQVTDMLRGDLGFGRKQKKSTLDYLSQWGPVDTHHYDDATGQTIIKNTHNVTAILENNRNRRLSGEDGYTPSRTWRRAASIPLGDYMRLKKQGIDLFDRNDWPKVLAMLDSHRGLKYRTAPGKLSHKALREHFVPKGKRK